MATLEEIFAKEFKQMEQQRAGYSGALDLYAIGLPKSTLDKSIVEKHNKVLIKGISDEYYSALNNSESLIWSRPSLKRRKFGSDSKFLTDKDGKFITEDVDVPHNCVALISDVKIGVPLKYKSRENFVYVDYIQRQKPEGGVSTRYIYIVPKVYCFKLNQVALVLSLNKLRTYYEGIEVWLQSGHCLFMFIVPYKPTTQERSYRVISTKTSLDFKSDISEIFDAWEKNGIVFPYNQTQLLEPVKDRINVAYNTFNTILDEYQRYNPQKSLSDTNEDADDLDFI